MNFKLELLPVPVADVDQAKKLYTEQAGFQLDHEAQPKATRRSHANAPYGTGALTQSDIA